VLGVDVSKDKLDVALVDAHSRKVVWDEEVANTQSGIGRLLSRTPQEVAWVVEPTGRYSLLVVAVARQAGRRVLLAPTRQAKRYMESHSSRAITDRTAARNLAYFGLDRPLREYPVKASYVDAVDQLLRFRRGLSGATSALTLRGQELPHAREAAAATVSTLKTQVAQIDKQIEQAAQSSPLWPLIQRLRAVPGIGTLSSVAFASRLFSKDFERAEQWVAYCGMDVSVRQSGKRRGELGLSKQGDAELRRLAYVCAQAAVRGTGSPFAQQFERERAKGMSKIAAYCAVARKLLIVVWAIHRHGAAYRAEHVYQPAWERRKLEQASDQTGSITASSAEDRATLGSDPSADRGVRTRRQGGAYPAVSGPAALSVDRVACGVDTKAQNPILRAQQSIEITAHTLDNRT
jgi:transposase